ncbi:uncharacterized protein TNCV_1893741 [Trichonephila clavipes]|nr:uncharacterized protein TNCV_1893741 [Trichonephila clavipes]
MILLNSKVEKDFEPISRQYQQTKQLPHVTKVDLVSWGCNLGQSLSNHGPQVFYRRKIRGASRPGKQFNLVIDEEPLDNVCHVWSHIILLNYNCGQDLKTRIRPSWCCRQMRDSSVKTTTFYSASHILLSSHHWWWRRLWFCVKDRPSNGRLADRPLCCKRRRMVRSDTE